MLINEQHMHTSPGKAACTDKQVQEEWKKRWIGDLVEKERKSTEAVTPNVFLSARALEQDATF